MTQQILANVRLITEDFADGQFSTTSNTFVQRGSSLDGYIVSIWMAPPDRLELSTNGLTVRCSTTLS